jgi:muramoyltetrapeptide carboxypeptidase
MWGFGREYTNYDKQEFENILIKGKVGAVNHNSEWKCVREGISEGILIGGNTSCINKLSGTKYSPSFDNKILFLEDNADSTAPAKFEGNLYHLKQLGVFEKIKGLWLGYYNPQIGISYEEIAMNVLKNYDFPILKCDDFGHNTPNTIIPIGIKVRLDATNKQVVFLENYVE